MTSKQLIMWAFSESPRGKKIKFLEITILTSFIAFSMALIFDPITRPVPSGMSHYQVILITTGFGLIMGGFLGSSKKIPSPFMWKLFPPTVEDIDNLVEKMIEESHERIKSGRETIAQCEEKIKKLKERKKSLEKKP